MDEQSSRASSSEGAVIVSGPPAIEQTSSVKRYLSDASLRFASSGIFTVRSLSSASTSRSQKSATGYAPPSRAYRLSPAGAGWPGLGGTASPSATTQSACIDAITARTSSTSCFGSPSSSHTSCSPSMNEAHSSSRMPRCLCDAAMPRPVYTCGPPHRYPISCVTRNLKPHRCARWCHVATASLALSVGSAIHASMHRSTNDATPKMPPHRA